MIFCVQKILEIDKAMFELSNVFFFLLFFMVVVLRKLKDHAQSLSACDALDKKEFVRV